MTDPFPTLSLSVCSGRLNERNNSIPIEANSTHPIPFETSLFTGELLLLVRANDKGNNISYANDNYGPIFEGKRRTIEFQIQGRFQRAPIGSLYMGIEITQPMKLGLVTKGLCRMLLNFMQRFSKDLHYSFGEGDFSTSIDGNNGTEYPHIVFPLKDLDRLVITKEGEAPPRLGTVIEETEESIAKRTSMRADALHVWNSTDTYTMSFNTMYVDLPTWRIVNVPIMKDMDLRSFWGDSLVRLVGYEYIDESRKMNNTFGVKKHEQTCINYLFCVQVS